MLFFIPEACWKIRENLFIEFLLRYYCNELDKLPLIFHGVGRESSINWDIIKVTSIGLFTGFKINDRHILLELGLLLCNTLKVYC